MKVVRSTAVMAVVDFGNAVQIMYVCDKDTVPTRRNVSVQQVVGMGHGMTLGRSRSRQGRSMAARSMKERRSAQ